MSHILVPLIVATLILTACGKTSPSPTPAVPDYTVISRKGTANLQIKVIVGEDATQEDIQFICHAIINNTPPHTAIAFFVYWEHTDPNWEWSAAKLIWAPDGDWSKALQAKAGNYTNHQLVVEDFKPVPTPSSEIDLPVETQRQIYYELVAEQDKGATADQSYQILADRYNLPLDTIKAIAREGALRSWPMPPPP